MMRRCGLMGVWRAAILAGLSALLVANAGMAQSPTRNGNVWNGQKHQPTEGEISSEEHNTRLAPTQQQRDTTDQELEQLNRQLLDQSRSETGPHSGGR